MTVISLTKSDFQNGKITKVVGAPGILLVYGDWCGHCVQYAPEYQKLSNLFQKNNFVFSKIESAQVEAPQVTQVIGNISSYPTIFFHNAQGQILKEYTGDRDSKELLKHICKIYKQCVKYA